MQMSSRVTCAVSGQRIPSKSIVAHATGAQSALLSGPSIRPVATKLRETPAHAVLQDNCCWDFQGCARRPKERRRLGARGLSHLELGGIHRVQLCWFFRSVLQM